MTTKALTTAEIEKIGFDISGNQKERVGPQREWKREASTPAKFKIKALTPEAIEHKSFDTRGN